MQDAEEFWKRSPVRYADQIVTPMLFVEGDDDLRTPPAQGGEAMFRALKAQKKTAVMVRFPGETHELSRSGKALAPRRAAPAHRELVREVPEGREDRRVRPAVSTGSRAVRLR